MVVKSWVVEMVSSGTKVALVVAVAATLVNGSAESAAHAARTRPASTNAEIMVKTDTLCDLLVSELRVKDGRGTRQLGRERPERYM